MNLRLSAVSQIEIIHLRVMQREIPSTVRLRIDNDFFHSLLSYSRRIATLRGRNDGGLKIISTKVAGFIYVSVEFTLQIVSHFMRLIRADVTCFLTQIYMRSLCLRICTHCSLYLCYFSSEYLRFYRFHS